jgi:hypothetical protein
MLNVFNGMIKDNIVFHCCALKFNLKQVVSKSIFYIEEHTLILVKYVVSMY